MSLTSKPLFQEINLKPEDLTSDDKVVWLVYFTEECINLPARGLGDIIGQQASESMHINKLFFYAGDMPDRDLGSKKRLVLAICFCPYFSTNHKNRIEQTMLAHAKSFPNNHRAAFLFAVESTWEILGDTLFLHHWCKTVLNVAGHFTSVLVRLQSRDWRVGERTSFNEIFGDLIRAGTDCLDVDKNMPLEIIKYVLNHDRFRVKEEMISWNPVVSTNAAKIYKKTLATITPGPLESYPFSPKK
ncbi:hypothetical protein FA15DRAFT_665364 [Coprinopsis marcescibilis]|uniref:Uncharacterized protein n=1 Tax=Coprinopsis marcescibilis TaxID=230819 RepID=A0A5C3LIL0_COPMA|nr:hypothetical protein FA15DRAFT_665364 [Coprinopsis marcescibilis]